MLTVGLVIDLAVLAWLVWRQLKIRPVRMQVRLPFLLGLIGLIETIDFTNKHHLHGSVLAVLAVTFAVGAVGLAALRALTFRLWRQGPWVLRQGTWLTVTLWLLSVAIHLGSEAEITHLHGPSGLTTATLLLFLAVNLGVQRAVLQRRALHLASDGSDLPAGADYQPPPGAGFGAGGGGGGGGFGGRFSNRSGRWGGSQGGAGGWGGPWSGGWTGAGRGNWGAGGPQANWNEPGATSGPGPEPGVIDAVSTPVDPSDEPHQPHDQRG